MSHAIENEDGTFNRRITDTGDIPWDDTHFCPASALTVEEAAHFRVVPFRIADYPRTERWQSAKETDPVKIDGIWTQQWLVYDLPMTLADKIADIKRQADDIARQKRDRIVAGTSPAEMASWPIKRAEALAYQSGGEAAAPNLAIEAQARGVPLAALVEKVISKANALAALEGGIAGRCGAIQDAAAAAQSEAELLAIDLDTEWPV